MQKLRAFTILLFVSFAMILGSCAEDESLKEIENNVEMTDIDEEDDDKGSMGTVNEEDDDTGDM